MDDATTLSPQMEMELLVKQYLSQMSELERKTHDIAKDHLGPSFHIVKSNGFIQWRQKQQQKK